MINSDSESFDEAEYPSLDVARKTAIAAATRIVADSLVDGAASAAVAIEIHEDVAMVARHVVTLSVADLSGAKKPPIDGFQSA